MKETLTRRCVLMGVGATLSPTLSAPSRLVGAAGTARESLGRALLRIEAGSGGRLGVAIHDTGSGKRCGHRATERFPMCSTFKVLACGAVLTRVDAGQEDLNRRIRFTAEDVVTYSPVTKAQAGGAGVTLAALCEAAITQGDNTAGNLILASIGGPSGVTAYARSIGDQVTRLDRTETALNAATPGDPRDTTTPDAMAANLRSLVVDEGLSRRSRTQLTTWLVSCQTGDAKLRAGLPTDWRVGDKTGGGKWGTNNDVAVLWPPGHKPLIVCVYLTNTKAAFKDRNATIAAVGRAVQAALPA